MSTQKHTAGPWEMHTDAHGRGLIYAESRWLATTWRANGEGNDASYLPSEANARLIAAAPELLEALRACEISLDVAWEYDGDVFRKHYNDATNASAMARAAISKAEGAQ